MEVNEVFKAYPKSVIQILTSPGIGFYIPVYQREFSWPASMVNTLMNDCLLGLNHLVANNDSITFIGSTIVIKDGRHETIEPVVQGDLPSVHLVIDGQQRLTTIALICVILHNELCIASKFLKTKISIPSFNWLLNETIGLDNNLRNTFATDMNYPQNEAELRFYPKIIRSLDDCWSRDPKYSKYNSPIGRFINHYIKHINSAAIDTKFVYETDSSFEEKYKTLETAVNRIRLDLENIRKDGGNEDYDFPDLASIVDSASIIETLFNGLIPDFIKDPLIDSNPNKDIKLFQNYFRLVVFSKFILNRIALTEVVVKNEDYAFDMFEALNTTGEPLTAIETFKPEVIKFETLKNWDTSESAIHIGNIDSYLNQFDKAGDKQKATAELLISFRLAKKGEKLSKKLSDQRKFLRREYSSLNDAAEKRNFTNDLGITGLFLKYVWPHTMKIESKLENHLDIKDKEALLCLNLLRASKHDITKGILIVYYSHYIKADKSKKDETEVLFYDVIKAIAGFYTLYRSSRQTTDGIDNHYRKLLFTGVDDTTLGIKINPFALDKNISPLVIEDLKNAFKYILKTKSSVPIANKKEWVTISSKIPIYKISHHLSRFILLAAHYDTEWTSTGLQKGRTGILPVFNNEYFMSSNTTVEHIAPQQPDKASQVWDWNIYDKGIETQNCLGNLTLLPQIENSSIGNSSWKHKKIFYKALSSKTQAEIDTIIEDGQKDGISLKTSTVELLTDSHYLPILNSITQFSDFTEKEIQERSINLNELAWEKLWGYLK